MMNLKTLLAKGDLKKHLPSKNEIDGIRKLVGRDIKDAQIEELSIDRRFATAYNAALNLARIIVISEGYRITAKIGHHKVSFACALYLLGKKHEDYFNLFEICRRKRNKVDYDMTDVATETELYELISNVINFQKTVYNWLVANHAELM